MTLPHTNFTKTEAYQALRAHYGLLEKRHLRDLFAGDSARFDRFSIEWDGLLFDYSKNRVDGETLRLLIQLARECGLPQAIESLFRGDPINETERRPALHTALRNRSAEPVFVQGKDVMPDVRRVLDQMRSFSDQVISGQWVGYSGRPITDVVNIGIGGSSLGPQMVTEALAPYRNHLRLHFVSNVDGTHIRETIQELNPETTLFLVVSKTFTTQETMANAHTAKNWLLGQGGRVDRHFVAVSTNAEAVRDFGIDPANMFHFWDWVGGRFSLWSAVGLSIALSAGFERFTELLIGGFETDEHFRHEPLERNIPVIMGLLGIWYTNFFGASTHAILPYDQHLHRFPAFLQQGEMESNGKSVDRTGKPVDYQTAPIIWGEPGTDGQHAFFQLLHQGTKLIPADFIAAAQGQHTLDDHHRLLLSNFFAQSEALMNGKTVEEVRADLVETDVKRAAWLENFLVFEGNRPSTSFLLDRMSPRQLGKLIALYEHKIFVQGVIWNIFSFDQWGVELGKQLAKNIQQELGSPAPVVSHDSSTNGLINAYKKWTNMTP